MTVLRMDHVGVVVDDLPAAIAFFTDLGLDLVAEGSLEGELVDSILGVEGVRSDIAFLRTPDGHSQVELSKFNSPAATAGDPNPPPTAMGISHLTFAVDDLDATLARVRAHGAELVGTLEQYEDSYRLCYLRGPAGIIVELAEPLKD